MPSQFCYQREWLVRGGLVLVMAIGAARGGLAADPPRGGETAEQRARFLMTGLRDNRERLRQGVVRVHGSKYERGAKQQPVSGEAGSSSAMQFY